MNKELKTNRNTIRNSIKSLTNPYFKAGLILIFCLSLTLSGVFLIKKHISNTYQLEFEIICQRLKNKINSRLDSQALLLRSCAAFYTASDSITRKEWQEFYLNLKIEDNLPGIQGLGFSLIIPDDRLDKHVNSIHEEGYSNYQIKPSGQRKYYTSTLFIEPFSGRNLNSFGYDMYTEQNRRSAMDRSRDLNLAILSGKVTLVQETNENIQAGVLMYVPVFRKNYPISNQEERKAAIIGWVFSPYRIKDLMSGIFGSEGYLESIGIELKVFENNDVNPENLLFSSLGSNTLQEKPNKIFTSTLPLDFNGKIWLLRFTQISKFPFFVNLLIAIVLLAGILISLLAFGLTLSILKTKISAKKIAEKLTLELKESENRYRALIESTPQSIVVHQDGLLVFANQATLKLVAANVPEEIVGQTIYDFIHPDYHQITKERVIDFLKFGQTNKSSEKKLVRLDKEVIDVEVLSTPVIFDGKPSIHVAMMDITERKKAEIALAESESRFRNLFSKHQAIMLLIEEGTETIIDANESASRFYGYSIPKLRKLKISDLNVDFPDNSIDGSVGKREKGNYSTFSHKLANGETRIVEVHSTHIDFLNKKILFSIIHDITERVHNEQEIIIKNTELQKLNSDKDLLMSILAHDLKGPFNSLLGFSDLLLENAKNYNSEKIEKLVSFISISAKNAYNLLDNLLMWSRSQSGKIPFEPQKLILEEVCEQIISDLRLIAESKNIELAYNGENDVKVFADLNMLKTIIRNLLSNALKFTQKGGKVTIKANMNSIETTISIHDNGIGISKEIREKLFNNSEIQTTKGTENETGTGLGLIICDAFVKRHGGNITVKSIEDSGTEFSITIPILNEKKLPKISSETINTPII